LEQILKVKVIAAAKHDLVEAADPAVTGYDYLVRTKAAPERGKANQAVCRLLAEELGLSARQIEVARGKTSRHKIIKLSL
jgi:uncharacterized protein YggU (UPF0235/DUF167 family)